MPEAPDLQEIELGLPLAGSEGLDVNHASRARIQFLCDQHQALLTQTQFADAKAAALMTILALVVLSQPDQLRSIAAAPWLGYVFLAVGIASIACCFWVVFPRFPPAAERERMITRDRWSWPSLAAKSLDPAEHARFMRTAEISQMVQSLSLSNAAVSRLLLKKYTALRTAFALGLVVLLIAAGRAAAIM